ILLAMRKRVATMMRMVKLDMAAIKAATEALSAEIQKIGQYMSQGQQQGGNPGDANSAGNPGNSNGGPNDGKGPEGGDNVKDAEFKEKK
ncbi:MAG: hypothetical protein V4481_04695, partial [Patescibacteria group bacterium]